MQDAANTFALGASRAMRAAAALPALFSSMKLIVELMMSRVIIPTKSCQSGGFPYKKYIKNFSQWRLPEYILAGISTHALKHQELTPPLARAMAMIAAASMTHDSGFHMNPKNFRNLLSCIHAHIYRVRTHDGRKGSMREPRIQQYLFYLLLLELVGAEDVEALLGLAGGKTLAAASQVLEHLLQRYVLLHSDKNPSHRGHRNQQKLLFHKS
jgi:hypothetical protein